MTRLALKSLWARRVRALTTTLAVVIGVGFVAGTYILTDTTFAAFDEIFEDSLSGTDVVITARDEVRQESGEVPSFGAGVLPAVKRVDGVRIAAGAIGTPGGFFDAEGEPIGSKFAPKFITSNLPEFELGDEVGLLTQTGQQPVLRVVGEFEDRAEFLGGAIVTQSLMASAFDQRDDVLDFAALAPGADADAVQRRLTGLLERDYPIAEVSNQQELKENQEAQVDQLLGLIYALLALAVIVSLFGIANTLALSIHERTRELGMLRAIGMSRRQVRTMIRYEAVITALIGAVLGMAIGVVFAALIAQPLADEGFALSYPIGQLVALLVFAALAGAVAAIPPARRASRLNVLEALQYE